MEMIRATALLDRTEEADELMEALVDAGYEAIEIDEQSTELGPADVLEADDLVRLGIASREAAAYTSEIRDGATLVVVSCDEMRVEGLFGIMIRHGLEKTSETNHPHRVRFRTPGREAPRADEAIDEGGVHRDEAVQRDYQRADTERWVGEHDSGDATGLSRRAHGDGEDGQQSFSHPEAILDDTDRFERSFLHHYDENYAHTDYPYGEYARAYHYGVILAEHAGFRDRTWAEVEPFARDGWDSQTHGRWNEFAEAVEYGWRAVRGRQSPRP